MSFPTASKFYYDWDDIPDNQKAGTAVVTDEDEIMQRVKNWLPNEQIEFIRLSEYGWHNKHDFAQHIFVPQSRNNLGLKADVVYHAP